MQTIIDVWVNLNVFGNRQLSADTCCPGLMIITVEGRQDRVSVQPFKFKELHFPAHTHAHIYPYTCTTHNKECKKSITKEGKKWNRNGINLEMSWEFGGVGNGNGNESRW